MKKKMFLILIVISCVCLLLTIVSFVEFNGVKKDIKKYKTITHVQDHDTYQYYDTYWDYLENHNCNILYTNCYCDHVNNEKDCINQFLENGGGNMKADANHTLIKFRFLWLILTGVSIVGAWLFYEKKEKHSKMKKNILSILILLISITTLVTGCNNNPPTNEDNNSNKETDTKVLTCSFTLESDSNTTIEEITAIYKKNKVNKFGYSIVTTAISQKAKDEAESYFDTLDNVFKALESESVKVTTKKDLSKYNYHVNFDFNLGTISNEDLEKHDMEEIVDIVKNNNIEDAKSKIEETNKISEITCTIN